MANPSTVNATASGKEVLRRKWFRLIDESLDNKLIDGDTDHIYTVISITWSSRTSDTKGIYLKIWPDATSGNEVQILRGDSTKLPPYGTFVFNDRLVITGTDELITQTEAGTNVCDVWISYIDQDWT